MLWKCSVCGLYSEGKEAPDKCPKCGVPRDKFTQLTEEEAKKIYDADRTNDIHMEIVSLTMQIEKLAKEGIELDLDPPCVSLFEQARDEAWVIKQRCKAEIAGHASRDKW